MNSRIFENQLPQEDEPEPQCPVCGSYLDDVDGDNHEYYCDDCCKIVTINDLEQERISRIEDSFDI